MNEKNFAILGGSSHFDQIDKCLILGGWNVSRPQTYLSMYCFDIFTLQWAKLMINTSGVRNRAYHTSVRLENCIYIFGGIISEPTEQEVITNQAIKCTDTEEGYKLVISECACGGRKGMTSCAIAPNRAILFGGSGMGSKSEVTYPSDLWQVTDSDGGGDPTWQKLDTDGECPAGRVFHTSTVFGDQGKFMVVCGGQDNKRMFEDLWLLDMSVLFVTTDADVAKPKGKGKGALLPRWSRIDIPSKSPVMRFMHSSFVKGTSLYVFGGVGEYGLLDTTIHEIVLNEGHNDDSFKFSESRIYANALGNSAVQSAALTVVTDPENNENNNASNPLMLFLFGGAVQNAVSSLLFIDEEHSVSGRVYRRLKELYPDPPPVEVPVIITHIEYPNGDVYDGDLVDEFSVRHGVGVIRYATDGSTYQGEWVNDLRHGQGTATSSDGSRYVGSFVDNVRAGHGTLFFPDGRVQYDGNWVSDVFQGLGTQTTDRGDVYEGKFDNGLRNGSGVLKEVSGAIYTGEWLEGVRSGKGTQTYVNGDSYDGTFLKDKRHGRGVCKYVSGAEYNGSWRVDVPNGYGTYVAASLDEYQGKWVAGKRCGKGSWRSAHGDEWYEGIWENDLPNGEGRKMYADGTTYDGSFVNGKRHGSGAQRTPDGAEYVGDFVADKRHGLGSWRGNKGSRSDEEVTYEGEWKDDKRHGRGKSTYASGSVYEGVYAADMPKPF